MRAHAFEVGLGQHLDAGTVERHDAVAWLEVLLRGSARMVVGADCPRVNDAHACDDDGGEFMAVAPHRPWSKRMLRPQGTLVEARGTHTCILVQV